MAIVRTDDQYYHDIADAIREKTGGTEDILPENMAEELNAATLEPLTVTPTTEEQTFTPESPCIGFSVVTVEAAPDTGGGDIVEPEEPEELPSVENESFNFDSYEGSCLISYESITSSYNYNSDNINCSRFEAGSDVSCKGFKYYLPPHTTTDGTGYLWDYSSGALLATVNMPATDAINAWITYTFPQAVQLSSGKYYVFGVNKPAANGKNTRTKMTGFSWQHLSGRGTLVSTTGAMPTGTWSGATLAIDPIIGSDSTSNGYTEYAIQATTIDMLANEVKRITGATGLLSITEMIALLQTVPAMTT